MWRKRGEHQSNRSKDTAIDASVSLIDESAAFLSGCYAEYLLAHKRPVPAWAWLNGLSHGGIDDIRALTLDANASGPSGVIAELATQMITLVENRRLSLSSMQHRILIPLEFRLAAKRSMHCPHDAGEMAQMLRAAASDESSPFDNQPKDDMRTRPGGTRQRPFKTRFWEV